MAMTSTRRMGLKLVAFLALCAVALAQGGNHPQQLALQRRQWRPMIEHIYDEQMAVLKRGEREQLGEVKVFFSLDGYFRTFRAIRSPANRRGIHVGVGDLVHLLELSKARVLGGDRIINDYGWATNYALLMRRARLEYEKYGVPAVVPTVSDLLGLSWGEVSDDVKEAIIAQHHNTIRFFMAHELGHLLHDHIGTRQGRESMQEWLARSRRQESEADEFALEVMLRTKQRPVVVISTFGLWIMFDLDETDRIGSLTHPFAQDRMSTICSFLKRNAREFGIDREGRRELAEQCERISVLRHMLETHRKEIVADWNSQALSIRPADLRVR